MKIEVPFHYFQKRTAKCMYMYIKQRFHLKKQMKFQTPFSPKPSHTNHTKYFNCLSWKYRITPSSHPAYPGIPSRYPVPALLRTLCSSKALSQTSLPCCGLSGRALLCFFHYFWGQILHSTAVFVYRTWNERRTHTLDPAEFFFWHFLLQTTQCIQPWGPIIICHWCEPRGWVERKLPCREILYYLLHIL